jgi:hypothetical protein
MVWKNLRGQLFLFSINTSGGIRRHHAPSSAIRKKKRYHTFQNVLPEDEINSKGKIPANEKSRLKG